jgi:predicted Zn-dependent protease
VERLSLIAIGEAPREILAHLAAFLAQSIGRPCSVALDVVDPALAYVAARRQLDARKLLVQLEQRAAAAQQPTALQPGALGAAAQQPTVLRFAALGVADLDLYSSVFTHVFGEARPAGNAALFSLQRLRPSFYGLPPDDALLRGRARREALHEVGHLLGLHHCRALDCVMRFSTVVEEVDLKPDAFCGSCAGAVRSLRASNPNDG